MGSLVSRSWIVRLCDRFFWNRYVRSIAVCMVGLIGDHIYDRFRNETVAPQRFWSSFPSEVHPACVPMSRESSINDIKLRLVRNAIAFRGNCLAPSQLSLAAYFDGFEKRENIDVEHKEDVRGEQRLPVLREYGLHGLDGCARPHPARKA